MNCRAIFSLLIVSLLAGCAFSSNERAAASKQLNSVDCTLHFSSTGLPDIRIIEYTITRDAKITQVDEDWERKWFRKRTSTRQLTAAGWQQFQSSLAKLNVYQWKPIYSPRGIIYDGYGWEFRMSEGSRTVKSCGSNAGPLLSNPKKTVSFFENEKTSADMILAGALDHLWESSAR